MPRCARLDAPNIVHHIIIRGIEKKDIFLDDKDRDSFIARCEKVLSDTKTSCYAWALLSNHVHLLLRTGSIAISKVMARILTGYAVSFNRRHNRHGHLFQNRYKSIVCQEDAYLKELVRYIHLNPYRAGIVKNIKALNEYSYCGHSAIIGKKQCGWQDSKYILSFFGLTLKSSKNRYIDFVEKGMMHGKKPELTGGGLIRSYGGWTEVKNNFDKLKGDERILGDSPFVMSVLTQSQENLDRYYAIKQKGINLETIEKKVCELYNITTESLISRRRQKILAEARSVFCFWAIHELGTSVTAVARHLGMTQPGAGYAATKGERIVKENGYTIEDNE
jgi:REP element-mobilizing transposase RayT